MLDDAALTLTPEYLPDFFDFFRALKAATIAPKASVYPGTTEYGPRFHVAHEAEEVAAWFSVESDDYSALMESIGIKRFYGYAAIPTEIRDLLKYAAFGVPRAYLMLLREYAKSAEGKPQQTINSILEAFVRNKEAEYISLAQKVPKFTTLIHSGRSLFNKMCSELVEENENLLLTNEKQLCVGLQELAERNIYAERMLSLLVEAGLLFGYSSVSHGRNRTYDRFTPHLAALIRDRAFSGNRGFSPKSVVEVLRRPSVKHPLRRSLSTLMEVSVIQNLKLDLPPCQSCGEARQSETSKHCHKCGALLTDSSTFKNCMSIDLADVPSLTLWQREKLKAELPDVRSVGDFLALSDPGSELRKMSYVGPQRAIRINAVVEAFVDEFLS